MVAIVTVAVVIFVAVAVAVIIVIEVKNIGFHYIGILVAGIAIQINILLNYKSTFSISFFLLLSLLFFLFFLYFFVSSNNGKGAYESAIIFS